MYHNKTRIHNVYTDFEISNFKTLDNGTMWTKIIIIAKYNVMEDIAIIGVASRN